MKIVQIARGVTYGDGASECVLLLADLFDEWKYENIIMARVTDTRLDDSRIRKFRQISDIHFEKDDIIIYHFCDGDELNYEVECLSNKKILIFQNITPPEYSRSFDPIGVKAHLLGEYDIKHTAAHYISCITMSEFSKSNLVDAGWNPQGVHVIPLITGKWKEVIADSETVKSLKDGWINFLFTGRIAPNKKIEDIIRIFSYYNNHVNEKSRLVLVGEALYSCYKSALDKYILNHKNKNVFFAGHVSYEVLEAYYQTADIFLCMSEHEGFCIPLIEAMKRQIPVIAYRAAAVPDTLGNAGILVDTKNEQEVCRIIDQILSDPDWKKELLQKQSQRVESYNIYTFKDQIKTIIEEIISCQDWKYEEDEEIVTYIKEAYNEEREKIVYILSDIDIETEVVVYGNGLVGKALIDRLPLKEKRRIKAICDNGVQEKEYQTIPILKHEECIEQYPKATYVITPQHQIVGIIRDLLQSGINTEQIKIYEAFKKVLL